MLTWSSLMSSLEIHVLYGKRFQNLILGKGDIQG